jgi:hypothetical protein
MYMIESRGIKFGIKRLLTHPSDTPGNIERVPHFTFKVRDKELKEMMWFGVFVYVIKPADFWGTQDTDWLKRCFCKFMSTLGPRYQLAANLDESLAHLLDVALRRKPSVIYGGNYNRLMHAHLTHGIELHVMRTPDPDMLAYGGFVFRLDLGTAKGLTALVLHRGVPLYNHLDVRYVEEAIQDHLSLQFPFIFTKGVQNLHFLMIRERERNQKEIVNVVARKMHQISS